MDDEECDEMMDWPPESVPGRPPPERKHTKYHLAKERALRRVHPRIRGVQDGNQLWLRILAEHNADIDFLLYDQQPQPLETKEWRFIDRTLISSVLLALERSCRLDQTLRSREGENRIFKFSDSFVYFLMKGKECSTHKKDSVSEKLQRSLQKRGLDICGSYVGCTMEEKKTYDEAVKRVQKVHPIIYTRDDQIHKYMLMSRNKAAKTIQKYVRGWLVRKRPHIQEMRAFWKMFKDDEYKEVVRTNSKITFRNKAEKERTCPEEDFFLEPEVLEGLLGEGLYAEGGSLRLAEPAREEPPPPVDPCLRELGIGRQILEQCSREQLEDLLRVCSVQQELKGDALKAFLAKEGLE